MALVIADNYSFEVSYKLMAALMMIGVFSTLLAPEPNKTTKNEYWATCYLHCI